MKLLCQKWPNVFRANLNRSSQKSEVIMQWRDKTPLEKDQGSKSKTQKHPERGMGSKAASKTQKYHKKPELSKRPAAWLKRPAASLKRPAASLKRQSKRAQDDGDKFIHNHCGHMISKKLSELGKKDNHVAPWASAVKEARRQLSIAGFCPVGDTSGMGKALYAKANEIRNQNP